MSLPEIPYLPGVDDPTSGPLGRYLPPVPVGIARSWLVGRIAPGAWILDPFGASPQLAIEAAQAGYRVLVAANNPILGFLIGIGATGPQPIDFQGALAELASAYSGNQRLELHIRSLYDTTCASCRHPVNARSFLWERGAKTPYARVYSCSNCGDEGEHPVELEDQERLTAFSASGLHRARALERVAPLDDPVRPDVDEALACYLARPLYALFSLINKLEGLSLSPEKRGLLTALLLSACDHANTLWPYPTARSRPRQLGVPPRFRENNLWNVLEDAIREWTAFADPVPLTHWPESPPESGGICLFQGRSKDLSAAALGVPFQGILTAFPRPNQAFWTLSALWSGWLWGREAVTPLRSALARRRYDWSWHASALEAALSSLPGRLQPTTPVFALLSECEPAFLTAALLAADRAGFTLEGTALRPEQGLAQVLLHPSELSEAPSGTSPEAIARSAVQEVLAKRGEPAAYVTLHAAALSAQAALHSLRTLPTTPQMDYLMHAQARLRSIFSDRAFLTRFGGGEHTLESGDWWLTSQLPQAPNLPDQMEMEIVRYLMKHSGCNLRELDQMLCTQHPGFSTPSLEFLKAVLESYGVEDPPGSGCWVLRSQDNPQNRRTDLAEVSEMLHGLGDRLGYGTHGEVPLVWDDNPGNPAFVFYPTASTLITKFVFAGEYPANRCLIVLPGSRSNLMAWKIRENPLLNQAVEEGWRFLKFRNLRGLADNPLLNRETFARQVDTDQPEYKATQLNMF